jgi:hypothetical protein
MPGMSVVACVLLALILVGMSGVGVWMRRAMGRVEESDPEGARVNHRPPKTIGAAQMGRPFSLGQLEDVPHDGEESAEDGNGHWGPIEPSGTGRT